MARVVVVAIALALVAVLAPAPFGHVGVVRAAPVGHAAGGSEEEPARECRKGPEPRSWSTRSWPARPAARSHHNAPGDVPGTTRRAAARTTPPVGRGREEHLRSWTTPSALQVFRN